MTYKGKEITENEITLDVIKEIMLSYYDRRKACWYRNEFNMYEFDENKIFDYVKVRERFIKYLHSPKRIRDIDNIEKCIVEKVKEYMDSCFTEEYSRFLNKKKEERRKEEEEIRKLWRAQRLQKAAELVPVPAYSTPTYSVPMPVYQSYQEQFQDIRWDAYRTFIFITRGRKCEVCGSTNYLQVHHPNYIKGRKAWEYSCNEVIVLCRDCHQKAHGIQETTE